MKYTGSDPFSDDNGVLLNKKGIKNQDELDRIERTASYIKALELDHNPIKGRFDLAHLKAIHKHLFSDIYPWAGKVRDGYLQKGEQDFTMGYRIVPESQKLFQQLKEEKFWGCSRLARMLYYKNEDNPL